MVAIILEDCITRLEADAIVPICAIPATCNHTYAPVVTYGICTRSDVAAIPLEVDKTELKLLAIVCHEVDIRLTAIVREVAICRCEVEGCSTLLDNHVVDLALVVTYPCTARVLLAHTERYDVVVICDILHNDLATCNLGCATAECCELDSLEVYESWLSAICDGVSTRWETLCTRLSVEVEGNAICRVSTRSLEGNVELAICATDDCVARCCHPLEALLEAHALDSTFVLALKLAACSILNINNKGVGVVVSDSHLNSTAIEFRLLAIYGV